MIYWEVQSGRPRGEAYHREVFIAFSEEEAKECQEHLWESLTDSELETWMWGPHVYKREGRPSETLWWDGYSEVPAPHWDWVREEVLQNGE